jgi:hypothetical protein
MSKVAEATTEAMQVIERLAGPSNMTQAEAVEFYEGLAEECRMWAAQIQSEMTT